ncbi:MAG: hypothetical protein LZT29_04174 [Pantoea stewartii]|uniref:DUF6002 family protein n=1 Tax=Pantoea stewartii TaxID=66269 RepID=UPI0024BE5B41|nr:DUF6002 family protein [Pantoea stewartii]WHT01055.1 MAG: hypothetical protein LZT29_04174 [Pantoea stewartii]
MMRNNADDHNEGRKKNPIITWYDQLNKIIDHVVDCRDPIVNNVHFEPGFNLPELDENVREFFDCAYASWATLGEFSGKKIHLMNLMDNSICGTTKIFPSLLIVARAVHYIRKTGESIMIVCPSSGNKAIALRAAVERAIRCQLVRPDQLSISIIIPENAKHKVRSGDLSINSHLARLNPVMLYRGDKTDNVKVLAKKFIEEHSELYCKARNIRLWYSLDIRNYKIADALRAFYELEACPPIKEKRRIHAHAVSSAYGLLGYNLGCTVLENSGLKNPQYKPGFLLVQHLATSDMVLNLLKGDFDRKGLPEWRLNSHTGYLEQNSDPHFPLKVLDLTEILEPTFYTKAPPTSNEMNTIIRKNGGTGIVVSLAECLEKYSLLRNTVSPFGIMLPGDPRKLMEWSMCMAFTGVMNAIERQLINEFDEVVIHASGSYFSEQYEMLEENKFINISNDADFHHAMWELSDLESVQHKSITLKANSL